MYFSESKARKSQRPIGIDLFAGAGGLSLGFEMAGFDVVAAVEIDPVHCATHKFNFPNTATICRSVTNIDGAEIRRISGVGRDDIDVVFGGAPCQGFSLIGRRALDDPRNALVHHFVRLVLELKPKYFVFENVRGLTVGGQKQFLQEIISAFEASGEYAVKNLYQVLNAADYGVPQDRRRLFLYGARNDQKLPNYPARSAPVTVWEAIGDLPEVEKIPKLLEQDWVRKKFTSRTPYAQRMRGTERDSSDFSYKRSYDFDVLTSSLRTAHSDLSKLRFSETACGKVESISRFLKLDPNGVCNTLRAGTASDHGAFTSPRPIHPVTPRCITVREAARLHSFPDWFRFHTTKWHGFRQIGNSVPPLLAKAVASTIIAELGVEPKRPTKTIRLGDSDFLSFTMSDAAQYFRVPFTTIPQRTRDYRRIVTVKAIASHDRY